MNMNRNGGNFGNNNYSGNSMNGMMNFNFPGSFDHFMHQYHGEKQQQNGISTNSHSTALAAY